MQSLHLVPVLALDTGSEHDAGRLSKPTHITRHSTSLNAGNKNHAFHLLSAWNEAYVCVRGEDKYNTTLTKLHRATNMNSRRTKNGDLSSADGVIRPSHHTTTAPETVSRRDRNPSTRSTLSTLSTWQCARLTDGIGSLSSNAKKHLPTHHCPTVMLHNHCHFQLHTTTSLWPCPLHMTTVALHMTTNKWDHDSRHSPFERWMIVLLLVRIPADNDDAPLFLCLLLFVRRLSGPSQDMTGTQMTKCCDLWQHCCLMMGFEQFTVDTPACSTVNKDRWFSAGEGRYSMCWALVAQPRTKTNANKFICLFFYNFTVRRVVVQHGH